MKKLFYGLLLALFIILILYFIQPLFGLNIYASELLGSTFTFLKTTAPDKMQTSEGYKLEVYTKDLDAPRFMHVTRAGDLLVTEPKKGILWLIPYKNPGQKRILLSHLKKPHSMDEYGGFLYVAEENAIGRVLFDPLTGTIRGKYQRVINNLPDDGGHWTRTIKFGPDGYGYVSIGSSCNVCIEENPLRASIGRFKPGDDHLTVYAKGLRNSVGFDWSLDGVLYATENSRDFLGDHSPPEELNEIKENHFYGWPFAYGNRIPDPQYGEGQEQIINESDPPVLELAAHQAPLGLTFIKNPDSPLYGKALIALHGSWNSSVKVGYKVIALSFANGKIVSQDFITGFLKDGKVIGRPVHIAEGKEGELYLSDDFNGVIYRITTKDKNS
ncbi:MAG TPA: PQQ-dependent sugar dehydrogenase [Legionella sp.]|nr:PQQ-dependent sugar dehydrogenase [Legionella sp.]